MTPTRRPALSVTVSPLPAPARGLEAEFALRVPSDVGLIEDVVDLVARQLDARFVDPRTIRFNVRVALAEALANAMQYGNRGDVAREVSLRVQFGRTAIEMEVADEGPGFDPATLPDPTTPDQLTRAEGRGVFLIQRLVDEVRFNEKGNAICMILRRT